MVDNGNSNNDRPPPPATARSPARPPTTRTKKNTGPYLVYARALLFAFDIAALAWTFSFLRKIDKPFSSSPSVGVRTQYTAALISLISACFHDSTLAIVRLVKELGSGMEAAYVVLELVSAISGITAVAIASNASDFIFKGQQFYMTSSIPVMKERKSWMGLVLAVSLLHLGAAIAVIAGRCVTISKEGTTEASGNSIQTPPQRDISTHRNMDNDDDLPPPWTAVDGAPLTDGNPRDVKLRRVIYIPRVVLFLVQIPTLYYMVWYIGIIVSPFARTNYADQYKPSIFVFGFAAISFAIAFDLMGACLGYFGTSYSDGEGICAAFLDLFPSIAGILSGIQFPTHHVTYYYKSSTGPWSGGYTTCLDRGHGYKLQCDSEVPDSAKERILTYKAWWHGIVLAISIVHFAMFVYSIFVACVVRWKKKRATTKPPPKYRTFDVESSQPPTYEMGVLAGQTERVVSPTAPGTRPSEDGRSRAA